MNAQNTLPVGDIQFLDNNVPPLTAGEYQIDVSHSIVEPSFSIDSTFGASQKFIVNAPRFALKPGTVQSCFPTPNAQNDFHENLPFIIFNDQTLPWARALTRESLTYPPSWLALMIFKVDELIYTPPPPPQQPNPTYATINTISNILTPGGNTIGPDITLNDYEKSLNNLSATTIDVLGTTFQSLAPRWEELPFVAHLRELNTGGQTIDGLNGAGSYSVLIGNRLPDASSSNKYIAHVVSIEGWQDYLPGGPKSFSAGQAARLVSLNSWTFTSNPAGAEFQQLIDNLLVGTMCLPLNPPSPWNAPASVQAEINSRYQNGYVALNYNTRIGESSFAWYRGPFNPTAPVMIQNTLPGFLNSDGGTPLTNADDAIIYDPVNGVFDLSYAVAFETGKMVTLANKSASLAIWQWKNDGINLLQILSNLVAEAEVSSGVTMLSARKKVQPNAEKGAIDWEKIKRRLKDIHTGPKAFMNYLSGSLGKHFTVKKRGMRDTAIHICDPSKLSSHNDPQKSTKHLPGLLSPEELTELSETGKDPYVLIIEKLNKNIQ